MWLDSSKAKDLVRSLGLVDADMQKLSSDPTFLEEFRTSHLSFVAFEAHSCIEDVLFSLQSLK